jgi:hypothetical protein
MLLPFPTCVITKATIDETHKKLKLFLRYKPEISLKPQRNSTIDRLLKVS